MIMPHPIEHSPLDHHYDDQRLRQLRHHRRQRATTTTATALRRLGLLASCAIVGGCCRRRGLMGLVVEARLRGVAVAGAVDDIIADDNNGYGDGANDGAVGGGVRRRSRSRHRRQQQQQQQQQQQELWWTPTTPATVPTAVVDATVSSSNDECPPPGYSGYHPAIGCKFYYWCQDGIVSSPTRYECAHGLAFDVQLGTCNWEDAVVCSRPEIVLAAAAAAAEEAGTASTDLAVVAEEALAEFHVVVASASAAPTPATSRWSAEPDPAAASSSSTTVASPAFKKRATSPRGKEVIGYWRSGSLPGRVASADAVDYAKLTRINYASYAVHPSGKVVFVSNNADGTEGAIDAGTEFLLGPKIWEDIGDGKAKNYCHTDTYSNVHCNMRDYRRGMLHLAHESGVEVYPSITLGEGTTLMSMAMDVFVTDAVALMIDGGFDGIDLDLALSETDPESSGSSPSRSTVLQAAEVDALKGILVALRTKIVELMVRDNRGYGLTMAMPCAYHATPNIADALGLVDEVNLMTFDFYSPWRSELVVPNSPLFSNPPDVDGSVLGGLAESVDSCVSDWTSAVMMGGTEGSMGAALARDKINVGLSFDGRVYRGAQALYGPHGTTMLPPAGGVEDDDAKVPYYEVYRQLLDGSLSRGWDDVTKTMFGGNTRGELITYEDTMSVCWKTEYGIESGTNGYFVWDLTTDVLDDKTTPLLDAINSRLALSDYDCTLGKAVGGDDENATTSAINDVDVVTLTVDNGTITGWYGPPRYYPDFSSLTCGDDPSLRPAYVTNDGMYQAKERCCSENFQWTGRCLGENFSETNFMTEPPTSFPSMMPSAMPTTLSPTTISPTTISPTQLQRPPPRPLTKYDPSPFDSTRDADVDESPSTLGWFNIDEAVASASSMKLMSQGLCAKDESDLVQIFRIARPCNEFLPCPEGLQCFAVDPMNESIDREVLLDVNTHGEFSHVTTPSDTVTSDRVYGLCAETEDELPFIFRSALACSDDLPCPRGLRCFIDTDFLNADTQDEVPYMEENPSEPEMTPYIPLSHGGTTLSGVPESFVSIPVIADATLSEEKPDDAFGYDPELAVGGGPAGKSTSSILKFDASFLLAGVTIYDIKLRLFVVDGSGFCGKFMIIRDPYTKERKGWSERSITYATAPTDDDGIVIGNAWNVMPGEWFELDLTGALGVLEWAREEIQELNMYITSTAKKCIYSSSNGPTSYAPHLAVTVKEDEAYVASTVASSVAPAAFVPPTDSPTDDVRPLLEPWKAYIDFSGRSYYYNPDTDVTQWERPVAGLCAKDETELPLVFRNTPVCTPDQICPEGLLCFYDVDFTKKSTEATAVESTNPPTVESTKPPTAAFTRSEPSVLRATDDATIYQDDPALNNVGQKESIVVEKDGTTISDILIRFDVSSIQEISPKKVLLALYVEESCASAGVFTAAYDIDLEWNDLDVSQMPFEGDIGGTLIGSFGEVEGGKWSGLDVTSAFLDDAPFLHTAITFRGTSDNGHRCQFGSIQGGKAPKLMIEF